MMYNVKEIGHNVSVYGRYRQLSGGWDTLHITASFPNILGTFRTPLIKYPLFNSFIRSPRILMDSYKSLQQLIYRVYLIRGYVMYVM